PGGGPPGPPGRPGSGDEDRRLQRVSQAGQSAAAALDCQYVRGQVVAPDAEGIHPLRQMLGPSAPPPKWTGPRPGSKNKPWMPGAPADAATGSSRAFVHGLSTGPC